MSDAPIKPQEYLYGTKVVDIADLRVARGKAFREVSACAHLRLVYDRDERRIWCEDCETTVDAFDAFEGLVDRWAIGLSRLERREKEIKEAEAHALISRAAKAVDKVWRSQTMTPLCPHCREALLPEDFIRGMASCSRDLAMAKRKRGEGGE